MNDWPGLKPPEPPPANAYIVDLKGRIMLTCPQACCAHTAFTFGEDIPQWWRPATQDEVSTAYTDIGNSVRRGSDLMDAEVGGNA